LIEDWYYVPMKFRVSIACLCLLAPAAWADEASKAAKIAELMQLTGARRFLHEMDSKYDQEQAVRAWGRYYSENVTEPELDAILAYYRSPAGQKDVSASRAALAQVQRYMREKHSQPAAVAATNTPAASTGTSQAGSAAVPKSGRDDSPAASTTTASASVGSRTSAATAGKPGTQPRSSPPRAPDGRVVPSPSSPERCEVPPTMPPGTHRASGRSVVCVCTDEKGALTSDPIIAESSGDPRVDSGALKMARVDSGRYIPPSLDGQPQSACFRFAIDFSHHE